MKNCYQCFVCGEKPCELNVVDNSVYPVYCPFDKHHNANWIRKEGKKKDDSSSSETTIYDSEQGEILK